MSNYLNLDALETIDKKFHFLGKDFVVKSMSVQDNINFVKKQQELGKANDYDIEQFTDFCFYVIKKCVKGITDEEIGELNIEQLKALTNYLMEQDKDEMEEAEAEVKK